MVIPKQLTVAIEFHSMGGRGVDNGIQWLPSFVWGSPFFKISSFVFNRRNSEKRERNSNMLGTTKVWVNIDSIFICGMYLQYLWKGM